MKILLVSYHFPPDPAVGATRTGRVARALREAGHEVHVVGPILDQDLGESGDATAIHRVRRRRNPREIALAIRNTLKRTRQSGTGATGTEQGYVAPSDVPQWKRFLVAMALFPDDQQGFILPAIAAGWRLHRKHRFDLIYTSGPPHSAHVAGLILKNMLGIRWAAEFRDPWTDNAVKPRFARSDTAVAMKRWLETRTLASADHIVAVAEGAALRFARKAGDRSDKVLVVRNGIEVEGPPVVEQLPSDSTFRISYFGNLYHQRDPRPLMRALSALRRSGELGDTRVELAFYGRCRWFHDVSLEKEAADLGLADWVSFHEPVPRSKVRELMAASNLLLLLAQDQPLQIPQKLYEYLGAKRPILAFADAEGETASMLTSAGGHFLVQSNDQDHVNRVVRMAFRNEPEHPARLDPTVEWSVEREMGRLLEALEGGSAPAHQVLNLRDSGSPASHAETAATP